jgi:hypothetical protein
MEGAAQSAGVAAHLEHCRVLGKCFLELCIRVEVDMRTQASLLLREIVALYKRQDSVIRTQSCQNMMNAYVSRYRAMRAHLCTVKAQYVALNEEEDALFLRRYGSEAVERATKQKTQWLSDMVREHGTMTRDHKARRSIIESSIHKLADRMLHSQETHTVLLH